MTLVRNDDIDMMTLDDGLLHSRGRLWLRWSDRTYPAVPVRRSTDPKTH